MQARSIERDGGTLREVKFERCNFVLWETRERLRAIEEALFAHVQETFLTCIRSHSLIPKRESRQSNSV